MNINQENITTAFSKAKSPKTAAKELHTQLISADSESVCVVFFCSVYYNLEALSNELSLLFNKIPIVGCTTAGEVTPNGYKNHSITGFSLPKAHFSVETQLIKDLASFSKKQTSDVMSDVMNKLMKRTIAPFNTHSFALSLLDGLSIQQEEILQTLNSSLNHIPLVGGSAGDDLLFHDTNVFYKNKFYNNAAVIILINTDFPFKVISEHHLEPGNQKLVVTEADPETRKVIEFNAEPAALEYCRITGLSLEDLTPTTYALNPLGVQFGEEVHIRSIQRLNDDLSLSFFCAIDVGVVLTEMQSIGIIDHTELMFSQLKSSLGDLQLVIAYDCIHRRVELKAKSLTDEMSDIYIKNNVIGFNSYGEQHENKHVNHTLSCVAIGSNIYDQ